MTSDREVGLPHSQAVPSALGLRRAGPEVACRRAPPRSWRLRYTRRVRSIADGLRERTIAQVLALTVAERIALAFRLGDDDLSLYVRASGLEGDEARRRLRARRQIGRTPSRSAAPGRP